MPSQAAACDNPETLARLLFKIVLKKQRNCKSRFLVFFSVFSFSASLSLSASRTRFSKNHIWHTRLGFKYPELSSSPSVTVLGHCCTFGLPSPYIFHGVIGIKTTRRVAVCNSGIEQRWCEAGVVLESS